MMVVSNTTPLNYLVLIGYSEILPQLFGQIYAPQAVMRELRAEATPLSVREWALHPPEWLRIASVIDAAEESLKRLQAGEREALLLYQTLEADLLLMDERLGRMEATRRQIAITGTLGILKIGSRQGTLDIEEAVERLRSTSFHVSPRLLETLLEAELR
jgi:predicted nucleic acid-binding protein